jgi:dTDP-4-dehydrorhamnose 3,5-epimerase
LPFTFAKSSIDGVYLISPKVYGDERGFFMEAYAKGAFESVGLRGDMVQQNHSRSVKGVLRGLHFQTKPFAQAKLVRCTRGEILDVAVDLRRESPTLGKWIAVSISEFNKNMHYVPRGFAHGFLTISDIAEVQYSVDNEYAPTQEGGVAWNDPQLAIKWPVTNPILSERDKKWPRFRDLDLSLI